VHQALIILGLTQNWYPYWFLAKWVDVILQCVYLNQNSDPSSDKTEQLVFQYTGVS
jgi:hypothetical protein